MNKTKNKTYLIDGFLKTKNLEETDFEAALIAELKLTPYLYDKSHSQYDNKSIKKYNKSWTQISLKLNRSVEECRAIWDNLKIDFFEYHSNNDSSWEHYQSMMFLVPFIEEQEDSAFKIERIDDNDDIIQSQPSDDFDTSVNDFDSTVLESETIFIEENEIENVSLKKQKTCNTLRDGSHLNYENKVDAVIDEVKKYPCIYNTKVLHKVVFLERKNAFKQIAIITGINSGKECERIWQNLQQTFVTMYKANQTSYLHYDKLKFLIPYISHYNKTVESENLNTYQTEYNEPSYSDLEDVDYDQIRIKTSKNLLTKRLRYWEGNRNFNHIDDSGEENDCVNPAIDFKKILKNKSEENDNSTEESYLEEIRRENEDESDTNNDALKDLKNNTSKSKNKKKRGPKGPRCEYEKRLIKLIDAVKKYPSIYNRNVSEIPLRRKAFEKISRLYPEIGSVKGCMSLWKNVRGTFVRMYRNNQTSYVNYERLKFLIPYVSDSMERNNALKDNLIKFSQSVDKNDIHEEAMEQSVNEDDVLEENLVKDSSDSEKKILSSETKSKRSVKGPTCDYEQRLINLIEEVKKCPSIYNRNLSEIQLRRKSFERIALEFPEIGSVKECMALWKNVRGTFVRKYKNNQTAYVHYDRLKFLIPYVNRPSNYVTDGPIDVDSLNEMMFKKEIPILEEEIPLQHLENFATKKENFEGENCMRFDESTIFSEDDQHSKPLSSKISDLDSNISNQNAETNRFTCNDITENEEKLKMSKQSEDEITKCGELMFLLQWDKLIFSCLFCEEVYEEHHVFFEHVKNLHLYPELIPNDENTLLDKEASIVKNEAQEEENENYSDHENKVQNGHEYLIEEDIFIDTTKSRCLRKKIKNKAKCDECDLEFPDFASLQRHKIYEQKKFECKECGKCVLTQFALDQHSKTHIEENKKDKKCNTCGAQFENLGSLYRHKIIEQQKFKCKYCGKCKLSKFALDLHENTHASKKKLRPVKCNVCNKLFPDSYSLYRHRIYEKEKYKCQYCGKCVLSITALNRHVSTHTGEKNFHCDQCELKFRDKQHLKNHVDKYHLNIRKVKSIKWVKCRYCDKSCKSVADRSSHELRHTGEKPYVCFVCGKEFARNTGYRVHMAIHENKQNIKCEIPGCPKKFNTKGAMKSHLTSHLDPTELNYSCPICNKKMKSRSSLGRHKAEHAIEKPFDCSVCGKAFAWKSLLDNHMRNHSQFRQLISN